MRQLFVYWKLPPQQAQAAFAALRAAHAALRAAHPGLQTQLFVRSDATGEALVTGMESYALPGGIGDALQAVLMQAGEHALADVGQPRRHVEAFELLAE